LDFAERKNLIGDMEIYDLDLNKNKKKIYYKRWDEKAKKKYAKN